MCRVDFYVSFIKSMEKEMRYRREYLQVWWSVYKENFVKIERDFSERRIAKVNYEFCNELWYFTNGTMDSDSECTCCDGSIELL